MILLRQLLWASLTSSYVQHLLPLYHLEAGILSPLARATHSVPYSELIGTGSNRDTLRRFNQQGGFTVRISNVQLTSFPKKYPKVGSVKPQSWFLLLSNMFVGKQRYHRDNLLLLAFTFSHTVSQPHRKVYRLVANHQNAQEKTLQITGKHFYLLSLLYCSQALVSMAWDGITFTTNIKNTFAITHHMRWQRWKPHYPAQTDTSIPWTFVPHLNDFLAWPNIFIRYSCEVTWMYVRKVSLFLLKKHMQ